MQFPFLFLWFCWESPEISHIWPQFSCKEFPTWVIMNKIMRVEDESIALIWDYCHWSIFSHYSISLPLPNHANRINAAKRDTWRGYHNAFSCKYVYCFMYRVHWNFFNFVDENIPDKYTLLGSRIKIIKNYKKLFNVYVYL